MDMKKFGNLFLNLVLSSICFSFVACGTSENVLEIKLTDEEKLIKKGNAYYEKGNWEQAIAYYDKFISFFPENEKVIADKLNDSYENQWKYYKEKKLE